MRLQLPLQHLELRLGEAGPEALGTDRACFGLAPVLDCMSQADEEAIRGEQPIELKQVLPLDVGPPANARTRASAVLEEKTARRKEGRRVDERVHQRGRTVDRQRLRPRR